MTKFIRVMTLFVAGCIALTSCNLASPEKYFDVAVLNCNMLSGFANDGLERELESPSVKMGETENEYVPMQRREVIDTKIKFVEANLEKIKGLSRTDETKEILQASLALHEFVLPVYKKEYGLLAKLYDTRASEEQIQLQAEQIREKYYTRFDDLYTRLINSGKAYAAKHSIPVHWD